MEESGNFLCVAGEQPQKGVREMRFGTEGKTGTERSGKRTEDTGSSSHSSPCSPAPPPLQGYHEYVDKNLPPESPCLYGLHPNAETGFLTATSEMLFRTVLEMQPKETGSGAGGTGVSREEKVGA